MVKFRSRIGTLFQVMCIMSPHPRAGSCIVMPGRSVRWQQGGKRSDQECWFSCWASRLHDVGALEFSCAVSNQQWDVWDFGTNEVTGMRKVAFDNDSWRMFFCNFYCFFGENMSILFVHNEKNKLYFAFLSASRFFFMTCCSYMSLRRSLSAVYNL